MDTHRKKRMRELCFGLANALSSMASAKESVDVMSELRTGEKEEDVRSAVVDKPAIEKLSPLQKQIIHQVEV